MMFQVSVITPVYNAATTVRRAVESAVDLPEVSEIILIDDAGPDNAIEICRELAGRYKKVRFLRHPDHGNHGAGASRNLGIKNARYPFVAFLDADDYYLPNRFDRDREILMSDPAVDGVYGATGIEYEDDAARERFHAAGYGNQELSTISAPVVPKELFRVLLSRHEQVHGFFTTDAITVRKSLLDRVGGFNPNLRLQQDTHLWLRLAAYGRLACGEISRPIAVRGLHSRNRMTNLAEQSRYHSLWWESLDKEFRHTLPQGELIHFRRAYAWWASDSTSAIKAWWSIFYLVGKKPAILFEEYGFFDLLVMKRCGKRGIMQRALSTKNRVFRNIRKCRIVEKYIS